jgi:small subunit ribosomal protein S14
MAVRKYGKATVACRRCGSHERVIRKYGLNICGRCFREVAKDLGFRKY